MSIAQSPPYEFCTGGAGKLQNSLGFPGVGI